LPDVAVTLADLVDTESGVFRLLWPHYFVIVEDMRKRGYLGQLELLVLLAAIQLHEKAYGVAIARSIEENSGRAVALASVYAALERLEGKGLITSELGEPTAERGGKARTYFKASAAGLKEAREAHATLMRLGAQLPALKGQIV
jgi:DNA-binding PadR family transcriptional regulator